MSERWIGLVVSGSKIIAVDVNMPDKGSPILNADLTWALQGGSRPNAYSVMAQRVSDYIRENCIHKVIIKASAAMQGRAATKALLEAAELRGAVMGAASSTGVLVECSTKSAISRTFGERKVDEYIADGDFWCENITGELRVGSREAAILILSSRD